MAQIKVAVNGALGRMGMTVFGAVCANPDTVPVGAADPKAKVTTLNRPDGKGAVPLSADLAEIIRNARPDVVVDFSNSEGAMQAVRTSVPAGVRVVSGSTGLTSQALEEIGILAGKHRVGVVSASNFALGAVLLMHLSRIAARYFDHADVVESHHETKIDSPSGTALSIARAIAEGHGTPLLSNVPEKETLKGTRGGTHEGINVHAVRMPGRLARHEVTFGTQGQTLVMIHDTINRDCYMPGVMLAVKYVMSADRLVVGLDTVLGLGKPKP
ncbi:MAG: 4-hydroxy-tetrahydrodipicolinate reductase [Chloroflexi bacterium]|nr:4-hydroxy-tetrahydrodipicolinate reductase [Chloroflexota bacterium]